MSQYEAYYPLWEKLNIDAAKLEGALGAAQKRHADLFLTQADRPKAMGYFDDLWGNLQTGRIAELDKLKSEGKPLVGTFCIFVPEESVTAAGGACYGLCSGSPASIPEAEKELPRNICPLIKSAHGFKLLRVCGYTQSSDFIYGETTCEAKKKTWEILAKHHPVHVMHIPQKKDEKSMRLWREEVEEFQEHIEEVVGRKLSFEEHKKGVEIINAKRKALRRLDALRGMHGDIMPISGLDSLLVMQLSFIDEPVRFTEALNTLCDELEERINAQKSVFEKGTTRLMILGTPFAAPNWKLHKIVESSGGAIVNEESCIGHRYFKDDVNLEGVTTNEELTARMMERYKNIDCACFTPNEARIEKIVKMHKERQTDGVIYYTLSFCHTYNVESHLVAEAMKKEGIPFLAIESDYSPEDAGQIKTRVEAFIESIRLKRGA
ncbi:double-cubane-cluster-containing anaerobic reductase [Wolinella succinogenes]|uniref:double-cubane-cluster-containing anaerobic reductase n=1 Tax=Wolinella succinogenes TaxID=844 RepID=UPI0024094BCB|nr:double-cubane-cluster-containing anaerobic reductase [Wolinella succinogenes]